METLGKWWSGVAYWADANFRALRSLSPDLQVVFGAVCLFVVIFFYAWLYTKRQNNALKRQLRTLADELAVVRQKYEREVKWRTTAEKVFGSESSSPS
jgi:hypothetical protein